MKPSYSFKKLLTCLLFVSISIHAYAATEFQNFIKTGSGQSLPLFGYDLFQNVPATFAPVDVPVTSDYIVGPGDEIKIRTWGQLDVDVTATVDRNGMLFIPKIGNINVAGTKFRDLESQVAIEVGRLYKNFQLNVSMGKLRSIQIFVVGFATKPGSYTVSSLSTLVNAIFAVGGPSEKGSLRNIQLKRDNKIITEFDMYDLITSGDKSKDARLLPGDIIYIPAVGSQVAISGSVNTSAIFEIKPNDSLKSLLQWNGGLTSTALGKKFNIERIKDKQDRSVEEFDYTTMATNSFKLQNGDFIRVYNISPKIDNAITVRGNVAQAQRFAWTAGMRILDVIPTQESVLTRNYWVNKNQKANQYNVDDVKLKNELSNQIADINWDYAAIERYNPKDFTTDLISFNLGKAVIERDPANNLELQNGDVITLFSKEDIRVPTQKQSKYVYLEGEVAQPGVYKISTGETLRSLLQRTGGITDNAYLYGSSFTRTSTYRQQQDRLDAVRSRLLSDIDESTANAIKDASNPEAIAAAKAIAEENKKVLNRMTSGKASGRIVLELPTKANSVDQFPDIMLEDNDRLYIPTPSATVSVMGLVYNENSYLYKPGRNYEDYIALAGSTTREADTGNIYILRADGSVLNKRQSNWLFDGFSSTEIQPGDTIVVPNKISTTSLVGSLKDWTSIIGQFLLGAAALKSLK